MKKKKFELKCMKKVSKVFATTIDDDESDEILSKMKSLEIRFAELSQNEIVKIFLNKFRLINLYRLQHMRRLQFESYQNLDRIEIESEILKLKKTFEIYKDFEKLIHEV
jgi:cupin superfamily acireductone dioxygenase involved in methionine salvage